VQHTLMTIRYVVVLKGEIEKYKHLLTFLIANKIYCVLIITNFFINERYMVSYLPYFHYCFTVYKQTAIFRGNFKERNYVLYTRKYSISEIWGSRLCCLKWLSCPPVARFLFQVSTVGPRFNKLIGGMGCPLLPEVR
jgi:hypothetical protein